MRLVLDIFYCVPNQRSKLLHIASAGRLGDPEYERRWPVLCKNGRIEGVMHPTEDQLVNLPICRTCERELAILDVART